MNRLRMKLTARIRKTPKKNKNRSSIVENNRLNQQVSMEVTTWRMKRTQTMVNMMTLRCLKILRMNATALFMETTTLC